MKKRLLDWLDRWVERHEQIRPIGEGGYIFRVRVTRHRGQRLVLKDGTVVDPGDLVGELHLDNQRAVALHAEGHGGFRFRQELFRMLPALGVDLQTRPEYRTINALYGASLFWRNPSLVARAGFEQRPLPPFTRWWLGTWERILLASYHPQGRRRLGKGRRAELREMWITRRTLARFAARAAGTEDPGLAEEAGDGSASGAGGSRRGTIPRA